MIKLIILIVGMSIVTYIPRLIPILILDGKEVPVRLKKFLQYIPYAALGALIFPGIINSTRSISSAAAGGIVSIMLSYLKLNIVFVILGGIFSVFLFEMIFL